MRPTYLHKGVRDMRRLRPKRLSDDHETRGVRGQVRREISHERDGLKFSQ